MDVVGGTEHPDPQDDGQPWSAATPPLACPQGQARTLPPLPPSPGQADTSTGSCLKQMGSCLLSPGQGSTLAPTPLRSQGWWDSPEGFAQELCWKRTGLVGALAGPLLLHGGTP